MTERGPRLVLLLFSLILLLSVWKSHGTRPQEAPVAFARYTATGSVVRVTGETAWSGIHKIPDGVSLWTVINVTDPKVFRSCADKATLQTSSLHGSEVEIHLNRDKHLEIAVNSMRTRERILLGVPLDANGMGVSDWERIPGIGPALARRIVLHRQSNDGIRDLADLMRVNGVGEKKLNGLIKLF